jgi:adenosine 3'-phospho 5'-phosphosulfate transporter B2
VFTTKGPVKGIFIQKHYHIWFTLYNLYNSKLFNIILGYILAQLVIKAICLLENSGALVDGLVSDGASTNRKLWNEFGVSGKLNESKNFFTHPLNDKRKVYVFSDAPHLIKTVRNRLHNNKYLKVWMYDKNNYNF